MEKIDYTLDEEVFKECCGEIYISQKRYLVFHCCICNEKYGELTEYLKHICKHYVGYAEESDWWIKQQNGSTEVTLYSGREGALVQKGNPITNYPELMEEQKDIEKLIFPIKVEENTDEEPDATKHVEDERNDRRMQEKCLIAEVVMEQKNELHRKTKLKATSVKLRCNELVRKTFKCTKCPRSFRTASQYNSHFKTHKKGVDKNRQDTREYKCEACELTFTDISKCRAHVRRHSNQKQHTCTQCSKKFRSAAELVAHQRLHTGERPFMCSQCGKCYITTSKLSQHMKRHNDERPYKCNQCDKAFYNSYLLKNHTFVHTQERNHVCDTCSARFSRLKTLQQHMKIHANLREYVCHICQQSFNQGPGLRGHLRHKHKILGTPLED